MVVRSAITVRTSSQEIFRAGPLHMDAPERTRSLSGPNRIRQLSNVNYVKLIMNKFLLLLSEYLTQVRPSKLHRCWTVPTGDGVSVGRRLLARTRSLA